ncbi:hypothetical protein D3C85_859050 [compost metagenome]
MHSRLQHEEPQHTADQQIWEQSSDAHSIHCNQNDQSCERCQQHRHGKTSGVEKGNDDHSPQVVNDRQGSEEDLQRRRNSLPQQRQDAQGECDVGSGWDSPPLQSLRITPVDCDVDQRRDNHTANGAKAWKCTLAPCR